MGKIAFIFPGQGAQHVGMGQEIISNYVESKKVFDQANDLLDFDLYELCNTENTQINDTAYTQVALLSVSIATLKVIEYMGVKADYLAGLSLGEYSALVASGLLSFDEAIDIVRKRGQYMQESALETDGGMAAIIGSNQEAILEVFNQVEGYLTIANYNSSKQIVIAGERDALNKSYPIFEAAKIKVIPLNVSGAFHSELMAGAAEKLRPKLESVTFNEYKTPYLSNVTGKVVTDTSHIKNLLITQVKSPVLWENNILEMIELGVDTFIEIGPGNTLAGLIKKIDRKKKVISVNGIDGLEELKTFMEVR
ncbi:MAG: [acyl-carrier-protein] S-malonyltransferase [Firmicutes bacterium HGW-Firmicutes-3]|jgi:[acyl-carrier-protein] S-malonyltransferase|nr:MAG: [acyl-carrier-protein] S-malonyltransferase [Firmicutes bacterium HGW-Firmicutes-3]